jgi:homoserine O-acetyltransferase/O-succinyltransferase
MEHLFSSTQAFALESGAILPRIDIAYHTFGNYEAGKTPVIWVCHALTANADVSDWWANIFGSGKILDTDKYFIVCANNLGSCYGSTSPTSINPDNNLAYGSDFPLLTIRDMVGAHELLRKQLNINEIHLLIGGSQGAQQCMEWAILQPQIIANMTILATNAQHSAWGIAFNEAQRMALAAGGEMGLQAARAIAMLSYRNYEMYQRTAANDTPDLLDNFGAAGYQRHQGAKLSRRFDANSYFILSKAMDAHNVGRGRPSAEAALQGIRARTLVIGISSDLLFPPAEQAFLAQHIPQAQFVCIDSPYGHDGFLTEGEKINRLVLDFLQN